MKLPDLFHVSIDVAPEGVFQHRAQQPRDVFVSNGAHTLNLAGRFDVSLS